MPTHARRATRARKAERRDRRARLSIAISMRTRLPRCPWSIQHPNHALSKPREVAWYIREHPCVSLRTAYCCTCTRMLTRAHVLAERIRGQGGGPRAHRWECVGAREPVHTQTGGSASAIAKCVGARWRRSALLQVRVRQRSGVAPTHSFSNFFFKKKEEGARALSHAPHARRGGQARMPPSVGMVYPIPISCTPKASPLPAAYSRTSVCRGCVVRVARTRARRRT